MSATITFLGAAETVTGSRYLVETGEARVLVDCGLFQGLKKLREKNWAPFPVDPGSIHAVVLTHAHIDHSGYLPRLIKLGFSGSVYCTAGTRALLEILMPDAGFLQEEEARYANEAGYSRHRPAEPLYTRAEAQRVLDHVVPIPFGERFEPAPGVAARFTRAGHILGSASVLLETGGTSIAFTGDVGRPNDPIMKAPEPLPRADYLVVESTYGDRRHPDDDPKETLARIVRETTERGGMVLVPSFAVGRAQHLLHLVAQLTAERRIPRLPVYLDSPMAINATRMLLDHADDHRLGEDECAAMYEIARYARTPDESKAIDRQGGPMIVISASGMATGGRVLHHLRRFLPDPKNTVLFVGYQSAGTRGRSLVDGTDEVKIHGQYVTVRARIVQLEGLSAHADYLELVEWLRASGLAPKRAFVTHGEPSAADSFRRRLKDAFGWNVTVPEEGTRATLG